MRAIQRGGNVMGSGEQEPPSDGPTALPIALGAQLRRLREAKGLTRQAAGYGIRASDAKISRLELGRVSYKQRDVADLLTLYEVTDEQRREALLTLAHQANFPGWWHKYGDVLPSWFEMYVGLEQAAAVIRTYQVQFIPGLFQPRTTSGRSRCWVTRAPRPVMSTSESDCGWHARKSSPAPSHPGVWAVVDENALRRAVGGTRVMHDQLRRLIELTELPNVTLQAITFEAGGHAAAGGPFTILRFSDTDINDIAYLEQLTSALYLDKRADVENYLKVMDRLCAEAISPSDTRRLLESILKES